MSQEWHLDREELPYTATTGYHVYDSYEEYQMKEFGYMEPNPIYKPVNDLEHSDAAMFLNHPIVIAAKLLVSLILLFVVMGLCVIGIQLADPTLWKIIVGFFQ